MKQIDALDQDIKAGVVFHRKLDAFCDAHESYKTMLPIFKPAVGRYAPVALDIILDYFLAKNWSHFYTIPYEIFSDLVYKMLKQNASKLPDSIQLFILKIVEDRWLMEIFKFGCDEIRIGSNEPESKVRCGFHKNNTGNYTSF
ncbi:MAG: DUF479 domain-containing protein [Saprospiraceae bacterium]|nr:DUF479 domain-containing protein [Saprospiraceae bacterium]